MTSKTGKRPYERERKVPVKKRIVPLVPLCGTMFHIVPLCARNHPSTYLLCVCYVPNCR